MGYEKNEQILALMRAKGPILPVVAAKEIECDIIIASAYLATMMSRGEVKMSHLKVGGSQVYYLPGQEDKLQDFADRLNSPDKRVYEFLKEKKILRDIELEPIQRVGLRNLKDFAIPLNVKHEDKVEIFWKWYLLNDQEAELLIKRLLHVDEPVAEAVKNAAEQPGPQKKKVDSIPEPPQETPKAVAATAKKAEEPRPKRETVKREPERKEAETKKQEKLRQEFFVSEPVQKTFGETEQKDAFLDEVKEYLSKSGIEVLESAVAKKSSELDLIISVPSAVGRLTYYCKAKNKKKSNEGDLASAYVQGQMRKSPVIYLSRGELTKRAKEMLGVEFKGMTIKVF